MSYATATERIYAIVEAVTPPTETPRRFGRVRGSASVAGETGGVAANSGAFRRIEIVPGSSRRGSAVNGTGPKQVVHDLTLVVLYPDAGDPAILATVESDFRAVSDALEDFRNYNYSTSKLQNVNVRGNSRVRRNGNLQVQINLIATYTGA